MTFFVRCHFRVGLILLQVKNPHAAGTDREGARVAGLQDKAKPHYPKRLQEAFTGIRVPETKFASLVPEMLNVRTAGTRKEGAGTKRQRDRGRLQTAG